jgi:hypothetical protein
MSVDVLEADLHLVLGLMPGNEHGSKPICSVRMLQHFQASTSLTIGSTMCKSVMHSFVARESWQHPHLMHMVLAVSAAHLKRLYLQSSKLDLQQQCSLAEAYHWEQGLQHHRKAFLGEKLDFDSTLATTFLSIVFAFSLDDDVPSDAYSSGDDEKFQRALDPMAATTGFRALREFYGWSLRARLEYSTSRADETHDSQASSPPTRFG